MPRLFERDGRQSLPVDLSPVWRSAGARRAARGREHRGMSAPRPALELRRDGDRVVLVEPGTGTWLAVDEGNVFDPEAVNDLP